MAMPMTTRLTDEQIALLLEDLQSGMHGTDVAKKYRKGVNVIRRIYDHVRQVGHYKGIKPAKELPEWGRKPRNSYAGNDLLPVQVIRILEKSPRPLRPIEVERALSSGPRPNVKRGSLLGTLSRLYKEGVLERGNGGYSLPRKH
jgi:hypothetical protein